MKKDSMSRLLIDLDNYFMYLDEIISSSKMEKVKKSACQEYLDEIERVIQEIYDLQWGVRKMTSKEALKYLLADSEELYNQYEPITGHFRLREI